MSLSGVACRVAAARKSCTAWAVSCGVRESGGCREAACRAREMSLKRGGEEEGRRL